MPLLYNRYIELHVSTLIRKFKIRKLHFEFTVDLSRDSTPNLCSVKIYNLSENTRNLLTEDHQAIELYADYNPFDLPFLFPMTMDRIFIGTTINVSHYKLKTDWVTEILAGDGNQEFLESTISKSYKKGTPLAQVFADITYTIGVPATLDFIDPSAIMLRGRSFHGKVSKILDQLADDYLLTWSFQQGTLEIVNANSPPLKDLIVTILSPDTGMIESPILIEWPAAQPAKKVDKTKVLNKPIRLGVQVRSLLQGKIQPGRLFSIIPAIPASSLGFEALKRKGEIKFPTATSIYLADKVRHSGSNFGPSYETSIEGIAYT